jgi:hypothetical protein
LRACNYLLLLSRSPFLELCSSRMRRGASRRPPHTPGVSGLIWFYWGASRRLFPLRGTDDGGNAMLFCFLPPRREDHCKDMAQATLGREVFPISKEPEGRGKGARTQELEWAVEIRIDPRVLDICWHIIINQTRNFSFECNFCCVIPRLDC